MVIYSVREGFLSFFLLPFLWGGVCVDLVALPDHGGKEVDHLAVVQAAALCPVLEIIPDIQDKNIIYY